MLVTSSDVGNLNPELRSRVSDYPVHRAKVYKSNATLVKTFSSFSRSLWNDYLYNYLVWGHGSLGDMVGSSTYTYYVKATAGIHVDDCAYPDGSPITVKTSSF